MRKHWHISTQYRRVDVLQGSGNILERGMLDRIEKEPCFLQKGLLLNKVYAAGILPSFFEISDSCNTSTLLSLAPLHKIL